MKALFTNKVILEIIKRYRTLWSLYHLSALAHWDMNTYMPKDGINARSEALSKIAVLSQKLFLDKDFVFLIQKAEKEKLNDYENAIIRLLKRELKQYQKLPPKFIEEFTKVTNEAHMVWKNAKEKNNFSLFEPYLEKIVELSRKKAEYLGYEKHPYDALLDEYEEGLTTEEVQKYFDSIKEPIISLIKYIKNSSKYKNEHPLENEKYELLKMEQLNKKFLELVHNNSNDLRLDIAPHPFSIALGIGDSRITTRYEGKDFKRSYSSTIHEFGHALYELQCNKELAYTPVGMGTSLIIHESQSRLWENIIGKSKEFTQIFYNDIIKLNANITKYSIDDIYEYLNSVKPSLIRTEADEVTYHLHVLIRFEIEKELIEGKISVKDLPRIWAEKYMSYLGVKPKNDSEGVLQDIHWSQGSIGYFPTYSMGTSLSVIWKNEIEKNIGKISNLLKSKEGIKKTQEWLKINIHQYGSTYTLREIVKRITGKEFNSQPVLNYLEEKYKKIY